MARERIHTDQAARQAAYRARRSAKRASSGIGWGDAELGRAVREFHARLDYEIQTGAIDGATAELLGETPADTLRKVALHLVPE